MEAQLHVLAETIREKAGELDEFEKKLKELEEGGILPSRSPAHMVLAHTSGHLYGLQQSWRIMTGKDWPED